MKLLVIDIQKGITDSRLFNFDEFIDNTSRIIQAARDNQIEVIYFQHDDGPGTGFSIGDEEFEIAEQVHPREGEKIFTKNINRAFRIGREIQTVTDKFLYRCNCEICF